jgi:hypothetical protein
MNLPALLGLTGTVLGLVRAPQVMVRLLEEAGGVRRLREHRRHHSSSVGFGWLVYGLLTSQRFVS